MGFSRFFSALAILAGCVGTLACSASGQLASSDEPRCTDPRPQVCTMIYAPVCAVHTDGSEETHASACNACADDTVTDYRDGPCEEVEL